MRPLQFNNRWLARFGVALAGCGAVLLGGCSGGWTGSFSSNEDSGVPPCSVVELGPEQSSSAGQSATEVMESWGGSRLTAMTAADEGWAVAMGMDPVTVPQIATLSLSTSPVERAILDDECAAELRIVVEIVFELPSGLGRWEGEGELVHTVTGNSVAALLQQSGAVNAGDAELELSFEPSAGSFTVRFVDQPSMPTASFLVQN